MFPIPEFSGADRSKLVAAFPQIEAIFRAYFDRQRVPGLAYGVVADGKLIHSGGIGVRNTGTEAPATPDSVFRIASMSKSFTGMAIAHLRDLGKLRLDEPVATYVPELASLTYPTRDSAPITVFQLLTMGGGFPQDDPWADRQLNVAPETLSAWMRGGIAFSNPPNVKFEYSNFGYGILGRIVTNVSGMPYQQFIRQLIFDPLGMTSTTYDVRQVDPARLAMGYRPENEGWAEVPPLEDGEFGSMGGLFTTITDFSRYMSFLLSAFPPRDDEETGPVRRSSVREMQQPWRQRIVQSFRSTPDAPAYYLSDGYGYGLANGVDSVLGYSVSHGGGLPGYGSFYRLLPDCSLGLVVFTNLTYAGPSTPIFEAYVRLKSVGALQKRALPPAPALLAAQEAITKLYNDWDDAIMQSVTTADASFFLDQPLDQWRDQIRALRAEFGKCRSVTPFQADNALRGGWKLRCARGTISAYITLAPTVPPLVQILALTGAKPLNTAMKAAVQTILSLVAEWDDARAQATFARSLKRDALRKQFEALRVHYGKLAIADVLEGNGSTQAAVRLESDRGAVVLTFSRDTKTRKLKEISFTKPIDVAFVP